MCTELFFKLPSVGMYSMNLNMSGHMKKQKESTLERQKNKTHVQNVFKELLQRVLVQILSCNLILKLLPVKHCVWRDGVTLSRSSDKRHSIGLELHGNHR